MRVLDLTTNTAIHTNVSWQYSNIQLLNLWKQDGRERHDCRGTERYDNIFLSLSQKMSLSLNKKRKYSNWKTQNLIWCHVRITPSFIYIYMYILQVRQCCFIYSSTIGVFQKLQREILPCIMK